jgi:hypothetical protein
MAYPTDKLDKLYEKALKDPTQFFCRVLEDPNYTPASADEVKKDVDKELQLIAAAAAKLQGLL